MQSIYIPVGIITKVAADHKIPNDEAEGVLRTEVKAVVDTYNQDQALAFFDDITRAALHVIGENNLVPVSVFKEILRDLEICDSVLMQLKGIMVRAYTADKRALFTLALQQFFDSLKADHLKLSLIDAFVTIKKHIEKPPEKPNGNDLQLMDIIKKASESVPSYVNKEKNVMFQLDRVEMICATLKKLEENSKIERVNPWS